MCKTPQTVALEELNSEYIALKRSHDSKDDASDVLVPLRTRYKDIRAKVGNHSGKEALLPSVEAVRSMLRADAFLTMIYKL